MLLQERHLFELAPEDPFDHREHWCLFAYRPHRDNPFELTPIQPLASLDNAPSQSNDILQELPLCGTGTIIPCLCLHRHDVFP